MRKFIFALLFLFILGTAFALEYNISAPKEVEVAEWFTVNVSVKSEKELNLTTYSYVYKGFNCVGQGWITNKKEVFLPANQKIEFQLEDLIKHGTEEGFYNLRIKLKFNNKTLNETRTIKIVSNENFDIEETYLYIGLVLISLTGLFIVLRKG